MEQLSFFLPAAAAELKRGFYYVPRPLIDQAPQNDATSLTKYTMHTRASWTQEYKYIRIYT